MTGNISNAVVRFFLEFVCGKNVCWRSLFVVVMWLQIWIAARLLTRRMFPFESKWTFCRILSGTVIKPSSFCARFSRSAMYLLVSSNERAPILIVWIVCAPHTFSGKILRSGRLLHMRNCREFPVGCSCARLSISANVDAGVFCASSMISRVLVLDCCNALRRLMQYSGPGFLLMGKVTAALWHRT